MTIRLHRTTLLGHLYGLVIGGYAAVAAIADAAHLPSRPISIVLRVLMAMFALGVMRIGWVQGKVYRGRFWQLYAAFWLLLSMRMAWDLWLTKVEGLYYDPVAYVAYAVLFCMIPMAGMFTEPDLDTPNLRIPMIYGLVAVVLQFVTNTILHRPTILGRMQGEFFDSIKLGHLAASVLIIGMWALLNQRVDYRIPKWAMGFCLFIGLITLLTAAARGPLMSLALLAVVFTMTFLRGKRLLYGLVGLVLFGAVVGGVAYVSEVAMGYKMISRLLGSGDADINTESRKDFQRTAVSAFLEYPATGKSLTISKYSIYPHNLVIESFMSMGILGGLCFTTMVLWAFGSAVFLVRMHSLYGWLGLLYIQWMFGGMFSGNLFAWDNFWALMGAVIAVAYAERQRRAIASQKASTPDLGSAALA